MLIGCNEESIKQFEEKLSWLDTLIKDNDNEIEKLQKVNELYIDSIINMCRQAPVPDLERYFLDYYHNSGDENISKKAKEKIDSIIYDNISEDAKNINVVQVDWGKSYNIEFEICNNKFYLSIPTIASYSDKDYRNGFDYGKYRLGVYESECVTRCIFKSYNMKEIKNALDEYIKSDLPSK